MESQEKINVQLHYASINEDKDIPNYSFDNVPVNQLLGFVLSHSSFEVVHLVCIDDNVFASHDITQITSFMHNYKDYYKDGVDIFWQEYDSYESAYSVALAMQESSIFCYTEK